MTQGYTIGDAAALLGVSWKEVYRLRYAAGLTCRVYRNGNPVQMFPEEIAQLRTLLSHQRQVVYNDTALAATVYTCHGWTALRETNPGWQCPECGEGEV